MFLLGWTTRGRHHTPISVCLTGWPLHRDFSLLFCEKWSGFFYVHRVWLSYTRDRRLKVSSERLGNEDKAPCQRALLPRRDLNSCGTSSIDWRLDRSATTAPHAFVDDTPWWYSTINICRWYSMMIFHFQNVRLGCTWAVAHWSFSPNTNVIDFMMNFSHSWKRHNLSTIYTIVLAKW